MEALRPTPGQLELAALGDELDRIAGAFAAGDRDLPSLGFWRVVGRIKRDQVAVALYANRVGAIDTAAFRAGVRTRVRPWIGVSAMLLVAALGAAGVVLAAVWTEEVWAGIALIAAGIAFAVGWHVPTHAFVGWLAGIRYTDAFLGGPPPPRPGLKTDYATYLRAEPTMRAWFHASGAIATKLGPFVALAFWPLTNAPAWAAWALAGIGVVQIVTDIRFSTTSSDWKKFFRERAVARERRR